MTDPGLLRMACLIGGDWVEAADTLAVENPASGETIAVVPRLQAAEVNRALDSAAEAGADWAETAPAARAAFLSRWAALLAQHQDDLAIIMTAEQGKPLAEARGEIAYAARS